MRKDKHTELMEVASWLGTQPGCRYVPPNDVFGRGLVTLDVTGSETEPGVDSDKEHSVVATISTRGKDRVGDIMEPAGVDLSGFRKNPVVLFAHNYGDPPIAKSAWERIDDTGIKAKPLFHLKTALSREVWPLYRDGIMNAWSIGFIPTEYDRIKGKDEDGGMGGYHITRWALLEYSAVPVPCNAEAVTDMLRAGKLQAPLVVKSLEAWLANRVTPEPKAEVYNDGTRETLTKMAAELNTALAVAKCNVCDALIFAGDAQCRKCGDKINPQTVTVWKTEDERQLLQDEHTHVDTAEQKLDEVLQRLKQLEGVPQHIKGMELLLDEKNELAQASLDEEPEPEGASDEADDAPEPEGEEKRQVLEISAEDLARRLGGVESGVIRRLRGQLD